MKGFFVAMMLAIMPYAAAHAVLYSNDPNVNVVYPFDGKSEAVDGGQCRSDTMCNDNFNPRYCYENGGRLDPSFDCESGCSDAGYDDVVMDASTGNLLGCGCRTRTTTEWSYAGSGREREYKTTSEDCGETISSSSSTGKYRCAAGYYGVGSTSSLSCTRCPGEKNASGTTIYGDSPAGATSVTQCELPAGTYKNATGTFTLNAPCAHD